MRLRSIPMLFQSSFLEELKVGDMARLGTRFGEYMLVLVTNCVFNELNRNGTRELSAGILFRSGELSQTTLFGILLGTLKPPRIEFTINRSYGGTNELSGRRK